MSLLPGEMAHGEARQGWDLPLEIFPSSDGEVAFDVPCGVSGTLCVLPEPQVRELTVRVTVGEGASLEMVLADCTAVSTSLSLEVIMNGCGGRFRLNGLILAAGGAVKTLESDVRHMCPGAFSEQTVRGVSMDASAGRFHGRIYVAPGANGTEAYQRSGNILLSDSARFMTEPQLEIYADDVKCSHGAAVGSSDADQVWYMRQRGLDEEEAKKLITRGFVSDVLFYCPDGRFRAALSERLDEILSEI